MIDQIIEHKGTTVPDAAIHRAGCSKIKRKSGGSGAGRTGSTSAFDPNPEVSAASKQRCLELREKARALAG